MKFKSIPILFGFIITGLTHAQQAESLAVITPKIARYSYDAIPKDPLASAVFSATLPGTGQLYNREYWRALAFGAGFWGGLALTNYMTYRWDVLNTDTFYIEERRYSGDPYDPPRIRAVIAPKSDEDQVGLPPAEKVILGAAIGVTALSYLWGVIDAWQGAGRYNKKLVLGDKVSLNGGYSPGKKATTVSLQYRF